MSFNAWELEADKQAYDFWTRAEKPVQKATPMMSKAYPGYVEYDGSVMTRDRFIEDYGYEPLVPGHEALKKGFSPLVEHVECVHKAGDDLSSMSIEELIAWLGEHDPGALVTIANMIRDEYGEDE